MSSTLFARETLAGYSPTVLQEGTVFMAGAGALANNVALNLALSGLGNLLGCDDDVIDGSNVTRAPLFATPDAPGKPKTKVLTQSYLRLARAPTPRAGYAMKRVEALGLGAFRGVNAIVSAVDSFATRAYLAGAARLLGIPFIEAGFKYPLGNLSVASNRDPEAPCWACFKAAHLDLSASCTLYSQGVQATGYIPATQSVAGVFGSLVTEATIQALHGNFPLDGQFFELNVKTGVSRLTTLIPDPECLTGHRTANDILELDVAADEPVTHIFEAIGSCLKEPRLRLPQPFVLTMPCRACGQVVSIYKPGYEVRTAPTCTACLTGSPQTEKPAGLLQTISFIERDDRLSRTRARKLGLLPGALFEMEDPYTCENLFVRLSGGPDDLFVQKSRRAT